MRMHVSKTPKAGRNGTKGMRNVEGALVMGMVRKLRVDAATPMRVRMPNQEMRARDR